MWRGMVPKALTDGVSARQKAWRVNGGYLTLRIKFLMFNNLFIGVNSVSLANYENYQRRSTLFAPLTAGVTCPPYLWRSAGLLGGINKKVEFMTIYRRMI